MNDSTLTIRDVDTRQLLVLTLTPTADSCMKKHKLTNAMLDALARSAARVRFAHNMACKGLVSRGLAVRNDSFRRYADNPLKRVAGYATTDNGGSTVYELTETGIAVLSELFKPQG